MKNNKKDESGRRKSEERPLRRKGEELKEERGEGRERRRKVFTFKISVNNVIRVKVLEPLCKLIYNALYLWKSEKMSV